jgi:UBA-like domain
VAFRTEKSILKLRDEREGHDKAIRQADSRDELQEAIVVKMRHLTNADEDVCIALLESNSYDVKTSIETFFSSNKR